MTLNAPWDKEEMESIGSENVNSNYGSKSIKVGGLYMNRRRYPISLFVTGFIMNVLVRFFWLAVPAIILLIAGIWIDKCSSIGCGLLILDFVFFFC